jgi:hypothetical protein
MIHVKGLPTTTTSLIVRALTLLLCLALFVLWSLQFNVPNVNRTESKLVVVQGTVQQPPKIPPAEELNDGTTVETASFGAVVHFPSLGNIIGAVSNSYDKSKTNLVCLAIEDTRELARNKTQLATNVSDIPLLVNFSFGCEEQFVSGGFGTGNFASYFYSVRLACLTYKNVTLRLSCHDANATRKGLVMPWLMGTFRPIPMGRLLNFNGDTHNKPRQRSNLPSTWFPRRRHRKQTTPAIPLSLSSTLHYQACRAYNQVPLSLMHRQIRYNLRVMAIALVGIPAPDHASAQFAKTHLWPAAGSPIRPTEDSILAGEMQLSAPLETDLPLLDSSTSSERFATSLDDAVIHFRCGDLMDSGHAEYDFLTFKGYTRYISPEARTIGILTQPFSFSNVTASGVSSTNAQVRLYDVAGPNADRCRIVVTALVEYIQERHPKARITIHNGPNETIASTFARMIMANQTIVGASSSFGLFPTLSTFGTGYYIAPKRIEVSPLSQWLFFEPRLDNLVDNVVVVENNERAMVGTIQELWKTEGADGVLKWFKS